MKPNWSCMECLKIFFRTSVFIAALAAIPSIADDKFKIYKSVNNKSDLNTVVYSSDNIKIRTTEYFNVGTGWIKVKYIENDTSKTWYLDTELHLEGWYLINELGLSVDGQIINIASDPDPKRQVITPNSVHESNSFKIPTFIIDKMVDAKNISIKVAGRSGVYEKDLTDRDISNLAESIKAIKLKTNPLNFGLNYIAIPPELAIQIGRDKGVLAISVVDDSPAKKCGLRYNDILIEFNKTPVTNIASMEDAVSKVQSGTESVQKFLRGNQEMTCTAKF